MRDSIDFIKIKNYAVINLNNMFPVPEGKYTYVDISKEHNPKYKSLLLAEYRYIKSVQEKIRKNAGNLYKLKISGESSALTKRCNDFLKLEELCKNYQKLIRQKVIMMEVNLIILPKNNSDINLGMKKPGFTSFVNK